MESKPHQTGRQLGLALVVGVCPAATDISCSPVLNSLAREGVLFDDVHNEYTSLPEFEHRTMFAEGAGGVTWQLIAPGSIPSTARFAGAGIR